MDGRSASQTGSLPRTASLFSFIIRHLSPFLAIIQAHCLPGPQNMRWSPPPFLPSSSPTPESPRPDPANPTCCRERPEGASPPRRWDLTARPPVGGARFPAQLFPSGSRGYFQPSQLSSNLRPGMADAVSRGADGRLLLPGPPGELQPAAPVRPAALLERAGGLRGVPPLPGLAPAIPSLPLSAERMLTPGTDLDVTR